MIGTLVLLRHGESEWNAKNLFTGWVDVDLTPKGEAEARRGGELLRDSGLLPDVVHTSVLRRNARMYGVAFSIDGNGDVYLTGRVTLKGLDEDELDRLLGAVLTYADESFDTMLEIGFGTAIRREWDWRVKRGESLANLQAFAHFAGRHEDG